jgi:hypothetical protein
MTRARAEAQRKPEVRQPEVTYATRAPMPATPPGRPSGSVLDFARYAGWSLSQVAASDPEYLEWLARTPIGRSFNREIDALLATRTAANAATAAAAASASAQRRPRRFRRS